MRKLAIAFGLLLLLPVTAQASHSLKKLYIISAATVDQAGKM
jgi:hypothetical protein